MADLIAHLIAGFIGGLMGGLLVLVLSLRRKCQACNGSGEIETTRPGEGFKYWMACPACHRGPNDARLREAHRAPKGRTDHG